MRLRFSCINLRRVQLRRCLNVAAEVKEAAGAADSAAVGNVDDRKLNMVIASTKLFSRREAELLINQKRVTVGGKVALRPNQLIPDDEVNMIEIDEEPLRAKYNTVWPRLWAIQKVREEAVVDRDKKTSRPNFFNRVGATLLPKVVEKFGNLKPVYRLSYTEEGMILLTNSGELARLLSQGKKNGTDQLGLHFRVRVHGSVNDAKLDALRRGVFSGEKRYQLSEIEIERNQGKTNTWLRGTYPGHCQDPKGLQLMFEKLFLLPTRIICTGFGPFQSEKIFAKKEPNEIPKLDHSVKEIKLPPELHKLCLRHMNANHLVQRNHSSRKVVSGTINDFLLPQSSEPQPIVTTEEVVEDVVVRSM